MTTQLNLFDILNVFHLIEGWSEKKQDGSFSLVCTGLKNEKGLTEGQRRILFKINKTLQQESEEINQRIKEAGEDTTRIEEIKTFKGDITLEDFLFEDLKGLSFSQDYSYVYEKICPDYL